MSLYRSGRGIWRAGQGGLATAKPVVAAADIYTYLVSWWAMEESANSTRMDSHGDYDLDVENTVAATTGQVGTAANFSETSALSSIADIFRFGGTFAIAAWARQTADNHRGIASIWTSGDQSYALYVLNNDNSPYFMVRNATNTANQSVTINGSINNQWTFLVAYYNATAQEIGLSKNGSAYTVVAATGGIRVGSGNLMIGKYTTVFAKGQLDEISVWAGYVPTADEVTWLYNAGAGRSYAAFAAEYGP